jgi:hypothetical protein
MADKTFTGPISIPAPTLSQHPVDKGTLDTALALKVGKGDLVFNVKDYSAVGDGIADDTAEIQACLDAIPVGGAVIYFPPGTYLVSIPADALKTILRVSKQNVTFLGAGKYASVIKLANAQVDYRSIIADNTTIGTLDLSGLAIRDLGFDQNATNNPITAVGTGTPLFSGYARWVVRAAVGSNITVDNCRFYDCDNINTIYIGTSGKTGFAVRNSLFDRVGANSPKHDHSTIYITGAGMDISGNRFIGAGISATTAIETHGDHQFVRDNFVLNYFALANITGVAVTSKGMIVKGNIGVGLGLGIDLWGWPSTGHVGTYGIEDVLIEGNSFEIDLDQWASVVSYKCGIAFDLSSALPVQNIRIINNLIKYKAFTTVPTSTDGLSAGIQLYRNVALVAVDNNIEISGNTIDGGPAAGMYLNLHSTKVMRLRVRNNVIIDPGTGDSPNFSSAFKAGMMLIGVFEDTRVTDNLILDDRATHVLTSGVYTGLCTGATNCEATGNVMRLTDNASIADFTASATAGSAWFVRYRATKYVTPSGAVLFGSEIIDTVNGSIYRQTAFPSGTTWALTGTAGITGPTGATGATGATGLPGGTGGLLYNVMDYAAVGDGVADDTTMILAAITAASAAGGGTVVLPKTHYVTATITLPAGVNLISTRGSVAGIIVPAGFNFSVIKIDAVGSYVANLVIRKASGTAAGASANGVAIIGASDGARIENVIVDGMSNGFYVAGEDGAVPATVLRLTLISCISRNSNVYGYRLDECDGVMIVDCQSVVSGLDGVKLRRKTRNVQMQGGYFTGAAGGDGLDAFAGGNSFSITGGAYSGNSINGITMKSDNLNGSDPTTYGYAGNATLTNVIAQNNGGNGVTCHRHSGNPDDTTLPLALRYTITGGNYSGNANYGLYVQARQVTLVGPACYRNGLDGIYLEPVSADVTILGAHVAGNSVTTPNARDGFHIDGNRIQIIGGSSTGKDPDGARNEADVVAGTATQRYGLYVAAAATNVDMYALNCQYNATGDVNDASAAVRGPATSVYGYTLKPAYYIVPEGARGVVAMLANVEYATPLWLASGGTAVRAGCEITIAGTAGTVIRLGLRSELGKLPGPVIGETTVAGDAISTGIESTVSWIIPRAGLYFVTATAQSTGGTLPTIRGTLGDLPPVAIGSIAGALGASPMSGYLTTATVTTTLPATYTVSNRSGISPLIALRG